MGGRFVESVKNARCLVSLQEAGDGLESIVKFQVQIKGHNQQAYEDKLRGWQNWTDEKLATKLIKDDQQPVLLLPARWWHDTCRNLMMMMIAFITITSGLVPLIEGLCAQIYFRSKIISGFAFTFFAFPFRKKKYVKEKSS